MEDNNENIKEQQVQSTEHISKHEIIITDRKSKKGVKVLLIILTVWMLIGIAIGIFLWHRVSELNRIKNEDSYIIIAEKLNFCLKKSKDSNGKITFEYIKVLPFCTEVDINLVDDIVQQDNKTYYRCTYYYINGSTVRNFKQNENYYLETSTLDEIVDNCDREEYFDTFSTKETQQLPVSVKRAIIGYLYNNTEVSEVLQFTQDPNRIKKAIVLADFNMDGEQDAAVILEDNYRRSSLFIWCYNKDTKKSYLAYSNSNSSSAVISSFKKDALIFIDSENLVKSPNNGIIYEMIEDEKTKYAVFYNPNTMQFEKYVQKPLSKIQKENEQENEDETENEQDSLDTSK